ncbi:MAG: bifunctional isocitrate dehydrogenase kinase/phosphatase [Comamonadaceae bacterium]|nr:bifunctional isocitrate dehydrogenase kinase/phosphatase [Comamonadaceae bacterium]
MADSKGGLGGFPWASAAVLVAFVASTQLVPHAFEPLRPAEKARAQAPLDPDLDVNARLWEDPFAALRRYETERAERCERVRKQASQTLDIDCRDRVAEVRDPQRMLAKLDRDHDQRLDDTLVVMGLLPGADFVGAEEARRRLRYATLAGLLAQDYVPDNAERLSLLEFNLLEAQPAADAPSAPPKAGEPDRQARAARARDSFVVPYELLSARAEHRRKPDSDADGRADKPRRYGQIALLWVDENALPNRKLDALARLTQQLMGRAARNSAAPGGLDSQRLPSLAVIGPSSTDALRAALMDLRCAADRKHAAVAALSPAASAAAARCSSGVAGAAAGLPPDLQEGYELLARAEFYNSASTAPNSMLSELSDQKLESFVTDQFNRITGANPVRPVQMLRTIGTDAELIKRLVAELGLRLPHEGRRIVIVAERDSLYAQSLVGELRYRLPEGRAQGQPFKIEVIYFFRGIDGVTARETSSTATASPPPKAAPLEWPESRDQLDYLRRLGAELKHSEADASRLPIGAIGIFANDVHDKLLVLQALHEGFSDRMFFTTDMDARYLHPRTQAFTRNLVVASSLPLAFYPPPAGASGVDLQAGTPPLRDIYQVSTYAAARRAGCRSDGCKRDEKLALEPVLQNPSVYEVGRSSAVPLSGYALEARPLPPASGRNGLALLMVVVMGGVLLAWPSTPSIRQARRVFLREPTLDNQPQMDMTAIVLLALHAGLFAYVLASLIEFLLPSQLGFVHALLLASLAAFGALLAVLPALLQARREQPPPPDQPAGVDRLHLVIVLLVLALWVWLAWPAGGWGRSLVCDSCEPVAWLEGVSAWPSHLIHLLALFAILWTLDWAWADTLSQQRRDSDWLRLPRPVARPDVRSDLRRLVSGWFEHVSVLFWRPGVGYSCDFDQLWQEYGERAEARPRAARTLLWYALTICCVGLLFLCLSEGQIPEVPVRGDEHRQMVTATLYAILLLLPLLVVAVADSTLLLVRFVRHLNAGRSFYPEATIEMFARALGEEHKGLWAQRFCALPEDRSKDGGGFAVHTLLDDWIDVQVVARRSAPVARLVIGPFVVLALLVVARSRLFDNWSLTPAIAVGVCFYVAVLIGLTLLLKRSAETTRRHAIDSMQADLRWLAGSGKPLSDLVEPYKRLIASVEAEQRGAFAPFFDQPLLKAMLVPLGGAGGTQLFDYLLLGR